MEKMQKNWKNNEKQGNGLLIYADESTYEGNWENGFQQGFGKLTTADGLVLEGEWKDGKINGIGRLVQPNGDRYEGSLVISNTKTDWDGLRTAFIKPEEGTLVTFPVEYPHYTLPIVSDDERYVIVQDIYGKKI